MDKKQPIPFRNKKRERQTARYQPSPGTGELADVRTYWLRFLHNPWGGPGRLIWTERMFWGNALIAGLLTAVGTAIMAGFQPILIVSLFIDAFFNFFLVYYLMTWVIDWVLVRMGAHQSSTTALRLEMIVLSGWLVLVNLFRLIPVLVPFLFDLAMLAFGVLTILAVRRQTHADWFKAIVASLAGGVAMVLLLTLMAHL